MKKLLVLVALTMSTAAQADPGVFLGVSYVFGANAGPGLSLKVLSSNKEDRAVASAGVSFYPLNTAQRFGADLGAGYLGRDVAGIVSWDFLQHAAQIAVGYVNTTDDHHHSAAPVVAPAPVVPPVVVPPVVVPPVVVPPVVVPPVETGSTGG